MIFPVALILAGHMGSSWLNTEAQDKVDPKKLKEIQRFEKELEDDRKIGKEAADYYDKEYPLTKNAASQARVEQIGAKLALISNTSPAFEVLWGDNRHAAFQYKFKVVESKDINAFSLPGGYIYVFQGLVDFVQSDDELAGVLAHEISHASERHVAWMQKQQSKLEIPLILATIFTGGASGLLAGSLVNTAITNGWSVKAEQSADYGGYQLMMACGYDPTGMITFMERLQMSQGGIEKAVDLGIFRTHPPSRMRADKLETYMKKSSVPLRRSFVTSSFKVTATEFKPGTYILKFGDRKLFAVGGDDPKTRATDLAKSLNTFFDSVPEMYEITVGEDGAIFGRNRLLLKVTPDDADVSGVDFEKAQNDAAKALRSCAFSLAYHIWEGRG